jgi:lipopolysaccharide O-acetyltransferase
LGESVCVARSNYREGCVVGALSVVTKSIPPYSIAVGSPAKVVKEYNFEINKWIKKIIMKH